MVLYDAYIGSEKGMYLQELFEAENGELYTILEQYNNDIKNYLNVKNQVADFLAKNYAEEVTEFTSLK